MYSFEQKNKIIIQLASEKYFEKDKELFFKHCSNIKLERDIQRANPFTYATVDGRILNDLLDKVSVEQIMANRSESNFISKKIKEINTKSPSKKKTSTPSKTSKGEKIANVTQSKESPREANIQPEIKKKSQARRVPRHKLG